MKKTIQLTLLFFTLLSFSSNKAMACDIAVENEDGKTIYYNYINDGRELEVTFAPFLECKNQPTYQGYIVIPEEVTYENITRKVTSIGSKAFRSYYGYESLTSITIPNSVKRIVEGAFDYCNNLTSVHITDITAWCNITFSSTTSNPLYYAHHLFLNGQEVKDLVIPNSATRIGSCTFADCSSLISVTIPNSVTTIGEEAFSGCNNLASVTIPNSVTTIKMNALYGCESLTSITIPNSVKFIDFEVFSFCNSLTSIIVEEGNTVYDSRDNCNAIIHTAENYLIAGCQNTNIPNSVTIIGYRAFRGCTGLTSITIPNSVKRIIDGAF